MKKILIALSLLFVVIGVVEAQNKSINRFYRQYKHREGVRNFNLPGWVIRLGAGIARTQVEEPQAKAALKLAKKIKKIKLLVAEEGPEVSEQDIERMIQGVKHRNDFNDMFTVQNGSTRINMLMRNSGDKIKNLLILVSEESEFVMVSLKTKLKIEDLNELLRSLQEEVDFDIPMPSEEPKPEEPKPQV
ncbi:MAG: DUF4252 domain-containing protein [Bacteroidota bacterium]